MWFRIGLDGIIGAVHVSQQTQRDSEGKAGVLKFMGIIKSWTWLSNWTTANVESTCTRDWTCVPSITRQILYHWITREVSWSIIFCIWVRKIFTPSGIYFIFNEGNIDLCNSLIVSIIQAIDIILKMVLRKKSCVKITWFVSWYLHSLFKF